MSRSARVLLDPHTLEPLDLLDLLDLFDLLDLQAPSGRTGERLFLEIGGFVQFLECLVGTLDDGAANGFVQLLHL
jgi:hypothetical protein